MLCAHDQLTAAFEEIVRLLHAYNRTWLPWRYRWLISVQKLPWLPDGFEEDARVIQSEIALTEESLIQRQKAVAHILDTIGCKLRAEQLLADPDQAFLATHPELGYAHNMEAWKRGHRELLKERGTA